MFIFLKIYIYVESFTLITLNTNLQSAAIAN